MPIFDSCFIDIFMGTLSGLTRIWGRAWVHVFELQLWFWLNIRHMEKTLLYLRYIQANLRSLKFMSVLVVCPSLQPCVMHNANFGVFLSSSRCCASYSPSRRAHSAACMRSYSQKLLTLRPSSKTQGFFLKTQQALNLNFTIKSTQHIWSVSNNSTRLQPVTASGTDAYRLNRLQ